MPAVYRYEVEQTRVVDVTAETPAEAVKKASEMFGDPHQSFDHEIHETSIRADKKY